MTALLHEYWEGETGGGQFDPVREHNDSVRPAIVPNARLVFSFHASSWFEAMQRFQELTDCGDYVPVEGVENHFYTDEEEREQNAYLDCRKTG